MRIFVKVKAKAREEKIKKTGSDHYSVWVKAPAEKGKANAAVIKCISEYFGVPKSCVSILTGASSNQKCVGISSL